MAIPGATFDEDGEVQAGPFEGGPDQGADAVLAGGGMGAGGSVDAHVIGNRDGRVAELGGTSDEFFRLAGAAQEGERGTGMELGEDGRSNG